MSVTALRVLVLSVSKVWRRLATEAERSVWWFIVASRLTRKQDWCRITVRLNAYGIQRWKKKAIKRVGVRLDSVSVKEKMGPLVKSRVGKARRRQSGRGTVREVCLLVGEERRNGDVCCIKNILSKGDQCFFSWWICPEKKKKKLDRPVQTNQADLFTPH